MPQTAYAQHRASGIPPYTCFSHIPSQPHKCQPHSSCSSNHNYDTTVDTFLTYPTSNPLENLISVDLEIYWDLTTFRVNMISLSDDYIASQVVPNFCSCPTCSPLPTQLQVAAHFTQGRCKLSPLAYEALHKCTFWTSDLVSNILSSA